jgi:hypothetical protein
MGIEVRKVHRSANIIGVPVKNPAGENLGRILPPLLPGEKVSSPTKTHREGGQWSDLRSLGRRWDGWGHFCRASPQPESLVIGENVNKHRAQHQTDHQPKAPIVMQLSA